MQVRPEGSQRFYSLRPEPFRELDTWLTRYRSLWEARLDKFAEVLERKQRARTEEEASWPMRSRTRPRRTRPSENRHRTHLPGAHRGRVGAVDDEGRHRIVVGPRGICGEGPQARPSSRRSAALRHDRDCARANRVHEEGGDAPDPRSAHHLYRGRAAQAIGIHTRGRLHSGGRALRRRHMVELRSSTAGRPDGADLRRDARDEWTKRAAMGWESELDKLANVLKA